MKQEQLSLQETWFPPMMVEEASGFDRNAYLRPWRYFRFYVLHEPTSRRTCWLPEGFDQ
jgi:hypothetical protein